MKQKKNTLKEITELEIVKWKSIFFFAWTPNMSERESNAHTHAHCRWWLKLLKSTFIFFDNIFFRVSLSLLFLNIIHKTPWTGSTVFDAKRWENRVKSILMNFVFIANRFIVENRDSTRTEKLDVRLYEVKYLEDSWKNISADYLS